MFHSKGRVCVYIMFNARVAQSDEVNDVFCMFEETTCNSNGTLLLALVQTYNLMISNSRTMLSDRQWQ